eukprot:TRINITY_DN9411_c0_g1_i11.p2 TRINITY_DN9411_c0_g1~~TRINITY_DN9411_c0_g1_i11.p2  ORF type:complete len:300 (+),score=-14.26 TRINITY_DN9411_c0_g1_i11:866-1765(+)
MERFTLKISIVTNFLHIIFLLKSIPPMVLFQYHGGIRFGSYLLLLICDAKYVGRLVQYLCSKYNTYTLQYFFTFSQTFGKTRAWIKFLKISNEFRIFTSEIERERPQTFHISCEFLLGLFQVCLYQMFHVWRNFKKYLFLILVQISLQTYLFKVRFQLVVKEYTNRFNCQGTFLPTLIRIYKVIEAFLNGQFYQNMVILGFLQLYEGTMQSCFTLYNLGLGSHNGDTPTYIVHQGGRVVACGSSKQPTNPAYIQNPYKFSRSLCLRIYNLKRKVIDNIYIKEFYKIERKLYRIVSFIKL